MKITFINISLFFFFLLPGFSVLRAGDSLVGIRFSEPFKMPKNHFEDAFIGDAKRGFLEISHCERKSLSFQKFDANLKIIAENSASLADLPKDYYRLGYHDVGDNTFWLYTCWNKSERKQELFARKIDFEKAGFDGPAKLIFKAEKLEITYDISHSADKKLLLVHYGLVERDRGSNLGQMHGFVVFDNNMNKVWGTEQDFPLYSHGPTCVDRDGNIYYLVTIRDKAGEGGAPPVYHYEVFAWNKGNQQAVKIPVNLEDKFVHDPLLAEDLNGNVLVTGYYVNQRSDKGADGLFICKVNRESRATEKKLKGFYNFPEDIKNSPELLKDGHTKESTTTLKSLVFNEDGTIQAYGEVTAESADWNSSFASDNRPYSQQVTGYYNLDIIAMSISKDGELIWQKRIPKRQKVNGLTYESGADYGNGFRDFSYGENKFFLFSDNPENANLAAGEKLKYSKHGSKGGVLMVVRVGPLGKISQQLAYNADDDKTFLNVLELHQAGANQMIATMLSGNVLKVVLVSFE